MFPSGDPPRPRFQAQLCNSVNNDTSRTSPQRAHKPPPPQGTTALPTRTMPLITMLLTAAALLASTAALFYFVLFKLIFRSLGDHLRRRTEAKRRLVLTRLGDAAIDKGVIMGFFHPYWYVLLAGRRTDTDDPTTATQEEAENEYYGWPSEPRRKTTRTSCASSTPGTKTPTKPPSSPASRSVLPPPPYPPTNLPRTASTST